MGPATGKQTDADAKQRVFRLFISYAKEDEKIAIAVSNAVQTALGDNGRVVLRYSGTEPLARVMVEAEHQADVDRYSKSIAEALRGAIGA